MELTRKTKMRSLTTFRVNSSMDSSIIQSQQIWREKKRELKRSITRRIILCQKKTHSFQLKSSPSTWLMSTDKQKFIHSTTIKSITQNSQKTSSQHLSTLFKTSLRSKKILSSVRWASTSPRDGKTINTIQSNLTSSTSSQLNSSNNLERKTRQSKATIISLALCSRKFTISSSTPKESLI